MFLRGFSFVSPTSIGTLGVADKFRFIQFKQVYYSPNSGLHLVIIILRHLILEGVPKWDLEFWNYPNQHYSLEPYSFSGFWLSDIFG